jgi:hypothetical protein
MKFFNKRFLKRATSILLLLIIVESIVQPTLTYALTTGPHQPEYISYEQPGATDMVNLLTGDFSFSLPILEVPGPDGSFSVPLTYNAGIGPDQEASWVGLGWTINPGAITRDINQYPDDASSEALSITMKDLIGESGIEWEVPGFGTIGHNSMVGNYGALNILGLVGASWGNGSLNSASILGIGGSDGHFNFDGAQFATGLVTVASLGAAAAAAPAGEGLSAVAEEVGNGIVGSYLASKALPTSSGSSDATSGYWSYKRSDFRILFQDYYHYYLDDTRVEQMYGVLNLGMVPAGGRIGQPEVSINGVTSGSAGYGIGMGNYGGTFDANYYVPPNTTFRDARSPATLGYDNYKVMAPGGISGSMKPYRFEVGSVAMPQRMTANHERDGALPYMNYKVPFIYNGSESNNYLNHNGNNDPTFNFGLDFSAHYVYNPTLGQVATNIYILNDPTFASSTFTSSSRIKASQASLPGYVFTTPWCYSCAVTLGGLPQANHVEWLSTNEIINTPGTFSNGFMDYFSGDSRSTSRNPTVGQNKFFYSSSSNFTDGVIPLASGLQYFTPQTQVTLDIALYNSVDRLGHDTPVGLTKTVTVTAVSGNSITVDVSSILSSITGKYCWITVNCLKPRDFNSIGGYSITSPDGRTYHFALPVSDYQNYTRVGDALHSNDKYSEIMRNDQFANTWVLTGITGPDFIDRNNNGAIDASDWGYWVKLNYGKYSGNYQWRIPFDSNGDTPSPDGKYISHSQGNKELYYLNSIETRSHVAIFLKDQRDDSYDASLTNRTLKLSEIALLRRQDYNSLLATSGIINDSGTTNSFWTVSTWTGSNTTYSSANVAPATFISQKSIKRIKFSQDYSLCKSTPNSKDLTVDTNGKSKGKLTLNRVSIVGRNDVRVLPDYKFAYGNGNPTYDANKWDAWGMYNSNATSAYNSHAASTNDADGSSWSLSQITTPQGSTINVNYERDTYTSISGSSPPVVSYPLPTSVYYVPSLGTSTIAIPNYNGGLYPGDIINISGTMSYTCGTTSVSPQAISGNYQIQSIFSNSITITPGFGVSTSCPGAGPTSISWTGTLQTVNRNIKGGGIRVGSIVLNDQGQNYKSRYLYVKDDGSSSGVVAQEPAYARTSTFDFSTLPGYPLTPVIYSQVSVLSGNLTTDYDFVSKQVYQFETPDFSLFTINASSTTIPFTSSNIAYAIKNEITDRTSKIGSVKSIKTYDNSGTLVSSTAFGYTNTMLNDGVNNYQGFFSEGTLMHDYLWEGTNLSNIQYTKMTRTTSIKYPYALQSVTSSKDGFTTETNNISWDIYSGQVVEKNNTSPLGIKTKSVVKPAYTITSSALFGGPLYPQMGPKALSFPSQSYFTKNMLIQPAAEYVYRLDQGGNITGLISGKATTWNNTWTYRDFNSGTNSYQPQQTTDFYRQYQSYVYKGSVNDVQADGSLMYNASISPFDFNNAASNSKWQQTNAVNSYDHFSLPLESQNSISKIYSSTKRDFNNMFILASASNASYSEFAYSGAEDGDNTSVFFGGEVARSSGSVVTGAAGTMCHTGQKAIQLTAGNKSFVFKPYSLTSGRTYRAYVWSNSTNSVIYYTVGGVDQLPTPVSVNQVGSWYRIAVDIPSTATEIGVKATNGTVSFDDFKFQPRDGAVTANVYDASTGYLTYTLGNDNLYTRYYYDDRGIVMKTYIESIKYNGERLVSERKDNYKRNYTNP